MIDFSNVTALDAWQSGRTHGRELVDQIFAKARSLSDAEVDRALVGRVTWL
jgi:hypothetical protein